MVCMGMGAWRMVHGVAMVGWVLTYSRMVVRTVSGSADIWAAVGDLTAAIAMGPPGRKAQHRRYATTDPGVPWTSVDATDATALQIL